MAISVAIIGSGPSAFYTADALVKSGIPCTIDMIERMCIQSAIERGVTVFDFLQGNEEYKYRFGAVDNPVLRLDIWQTESSNA